MRVIYGPSGFDWPDLPNSSRRYVPKLIPDLSVAPPSISDSQIFEPGISFPPPPDINALQATLADAEPFKELGPRIYFRSEPTLFPPTIPESASFVFVPSVSPVLEPPSLSASSIFSPSLISEIPSINALQGTLWDKAPFVPFDSRIIALPSIPNIQPPGLSATTIFLPTISGGTVQVIPQIARGIVQPEYGKVEPSAYWEVVDDGVVISLPLIDSTSIFVPTVINQVSIIPLFRTRLDKAADKLLESRTFLPTPGAPPPGPTSINAVQGELWDQAPILALVSRVFPGPTPFAPDTLFPPFLSLTTIFNDAVGLGLDLPTLSLTQIFAPSVSPVLQLATISQSQIFVPDVLPRLDPPSLSQTQIFSPVLALFVTNAFLDQTQIFAPSISGGVPPAAGTKYRWLGLQKISLGL